MFLGFAGMNLARCEVCGRQYDADSYQVVVPGLPQAFDRVECALVGRALEERTVALHAVPAPVAELEPLERLAAELFVERLERNNERRRREELEAENARLVRELEEVSSGVSVPGARRHWWMRALRRGVRPAA
jgi:hypothetical protein